MAQYKEIEIPEKLVGLIEHISSVENTREQLSTLGQNWDLLTILGQMSGSRTDMTPIRSGFKHLTSELLVNLANESINKIKVDINSKAQVAVDIVIRNLFERTADIGFLATDDDIRDFLRDKSSNECEKNKLVSRFQEYVAKYSVYHNIILLSPQGEVLAQLDSSNKITHSNDSLITESINTSEDYCETYRYSDLQANEDKSLIYSYRVCENNNKGSKVLGVLCLCFKFEDEMSGIFNNLMSNTDKSVISLLDDKGCVIASSDKYQLPNGAKLKPALAGEFELIDFAGRTYIAKTCETKGYQGFEGLGWYGHVMLPIEQAFRADLSGFGLQDVSQNILDSVMQDPRLFSESLRKIPNSANAIQADLERTVWNGNVSQSIKNGNKGAQSIKILLAEIGKTGSQTKRVFERSISQLHQTVVSSIMNDVKFLSFLAIDIMDRNLYERANDCRWWALSSAFKDILSAPSISDEDQTSLTNILSYINDLYTVYTNLFIYDKHGKVLAVSKPSEKHLVGKTVSNKWLKESLSIRDSQQYVVSDFEKTSLYNDKHTYVYSAAITASNNSGQVVGGIGIVFDSEPEFAEMLNDTLPIESEDSKDETSFAVFIDRNKTLISSTSARFTVGDKFDIDDKFIKLNVGESRSQIIEIDSAYYALGTCASKGYREYKSDSDNYNNDVISLVFMLLGDKKSTVSKIYNTNTGSIGYNGDKSHDTNNERIELATFYVEDNWLALDCKNIVEAIGIDKISQRQGQNSLMAGTTIYNDTIIPVINLTYALDNQKTKLNINASTQIVVINTVKGLVGLLVDALGEIPEIDKDKFTNMSDVVASQSQFIDSIVKSDTTEAGHSMLIVLEPNKLLNLVLSGDAEMIHDLLNQLNTIE